MSSEHEQLALLLWYPQAFGCVATAIALCFRDIAPLPNMLSSRSLLFAFLALVSFGLCAAAQQPGQQFFSSACASCHGLDGRGGEHAPNIATDANVQALTDRDLVRIVRNGIPSAGMPGFGSSLDEAQLPAVVQYLRTLQGQRKAVLIGGNAEHGRKLFFGSAQCSSCHMIGGRGGFLGADLSSYVSGHGPDEIREAIVDPNKNLDPRHGAVVVTSRDGTKYTGMIRNEDNFSLQMQTDDGAFHFFDKSAVARIEHSARSLMPADYESKLGKQGVDDVIVFLLKASVQPRSLHKDEVE
ncbi:MAG: c-type cytochrome [Acidobacteriaceae bacterium]|nr:c-type cytochrome [Acidobacteriaceae bacterium]